MIGVQGRHERDERTCGDGLQLVQRCPASSLSLPFHLRRLLRRLLVCCAVLSCSWPCSNKPAIAHFLRRAISCQHACDGSIMNTYMASPAPVNDSYFLGNHRHTSLALPHPEQDTYSSPYTCSSSAACTEFCTPHLHTAPSRCDWHRKNAHQDKIHHKAYPSPPLTTAALRSTVSLPDVTLDVSLEYLMCERSAELTRLSSMSPDIREPLSPPPTDRVHTLQLPPDPTEWTSTKLPFGSGRFPQDSHQRAKHYDELHREHVAHCSFDQSCDHPLHGPVPGPSSSRGWSFEGNLSELSSVPEDCEMQIGRSPVRADSGFEESLPQRKSSTSGLPELSEEADAQYSKLEPSAYWAPTSPLGMHGHLSLDDHSFNPAVARGDYRHESTYFVSSSHHDMNSTPSWASVDWSTSSEHESDFSPPASPRPPSLALSLDLPDLDSPPSPSDRIDFDAPTSTSPLRESSWSNGGYDSHADQSLFDLHHPPPMDGGSPSSPRPPVLLLPLSDFEPDPSNVSTSVLHDEQQWQPMSSWPPPETPLYTSPQGQFSDEHCPTPIPRSSHGLFTSLSDFDMDDQLELPPAPSSPHLSLPGLADDDLPSSDDAYPHISLDTIAPSELSPLCPSDEGLGLFLQPISIDPPLARSPSPDDDDLQFLDVQLDPVSSSLDSDEFLELRRIRRRALNAERAAREAEAEYTERITAVASSLLPPNHSSPNAEQSECDPDLATAPLSADEKRARQRELHIAMDMRADARRRRKREKQRSKEVGALMDYKMHRVESPEHGLATLIASMVLRRSDVFRPLASRRADFPRRVYAPSPLSQCVSLEDVVADEMDMDMDVDVDANENFDADADEDAVMVDA